jgi:hypothetical protein
MVISSAIESARDWGTPTEDFDAVRAAVRGSDVEVLGAIHDSAGTGESHAADQLTALRVVRSR